MKILDTGMKRIISRAAALALAVLVAAPVMSVTAFAAEGDVIEGDVRQHVITGYGPGEFQHNEDCRQEDVGVIISPESDQFRHDDRLCYKTGLSVGGSTFDPDAQNPVTDGDGDGEEDANADEHGDAVIHDDTCFQRDVLTCGEEDGEHEHGRSCYETGWVDDIPGAKHDDVKDTHVPRLSSPKASTMADSMLADAGLVGRALDVLLGDDADGNPDGGIMAIAETDNFEPLPSTGGEGIAILMALGMIGVIASAGVMFGTRRRFDN